jgi:hypothetical protein
VVDLVVEQEVLEQMVVQLLHQEDFLEHQQC